MKTATGCRPDQLFGLWSIEEVRFRSMVDLVRAADLEKLRAEAKAAAALRADQGPGYAIHAGGIAVIELSGPMTKYSTSFSELLGGSSTIRAREALRAAARDPQVAGIMLVIDSPGGTVSGTAELAEEIRRADAVKPVHGHADDLAASAALWALAQTRFATANVSSEIGSIGVYAVVEDTSGTYEKAGVKVHVVSSAPPIKGAGVDGAEITSEQLAEWKRRIDDVAGVFTADLARGRRMTNEKAQSMATGQVWVADKARDLGLIDGVMSLDEAMARLRSETMNEQDLKAAQDRAAAEETARKKLEADMAELKTRFEATERKAADLEREKRSARFAAEAKQLETPTDFAEVLDKIEAAVGADLYVKLATQLRAFQAQVATGALYGEQGTGGGTGAGSGSAADQIAVLSRQYVKDGRAKTKEQATALVAREHPDLYQQHVEEQRRH